MQQQVAKGRAGHFKDFSFLLYVKWGGAAQFCDVVDLCSNRITVVLELEERLRDVGVGLGRGW